MEITKIALVMLTLMQSSDAQGKFIEGGLEGKDGNSITIQNYRAIEAAYAKEFIRAVDSSSLSSSQLTFVQQKGFLSQNMKDLLDVFDFKPHELDFLNGESISDNSYVNQAFSEETFLLKDHEMKINRSLVDPLDVLLDHVKLILDKTMTVSRSFDRNELATSVAVKDSIATYILHKFASLGYLTAVQKFVPMHFVHALPSFEGKGTVKGTNIIALAPGKNFGTKTDRILVVGAHWDTVSNSPGYNDNGSGIAALLELARALKQSECTNSHTFILVALDMEETGTQGATAFVQEFLIKRLLKPTGFPEFQGAYILDSIANFNDTEGAQLLPETYQNQLPDFSRDVILNSFRGDFIGVIGRGADQPLFEMLSHHWRQQPNDRGYYKLRNMVLPQELSTLFPSEASLVRNTNFLRSDHIRFWFANNVDYYASFKSVHISDTGPARGIMAECYHNFCDTAELNKTIPFANLGFLKKIIQTMVDVVVDATDSQCSRSLREIHRLDHNLDASYFFENKSGPSVYQLPTNSLGEPTIKTDNSDLDLDRIEEFANVKLSQGLRGQPENKETLGQKN